jgi:predicted esterase
MSVRVQSVLTPTHGRVVIRPGLISGKRDPVSFPAVTVAGFHGYAQNAEDMMDVLKRIPGADHCTLVSVQALHRFYTRGDQKIVASWMTRQDREQTIADNIVYVDRALDGNETGTLFSEKSPGLIFVGFSQGVAMAYRAALLGKHPAAAIVAIGGDVPPDVKDVPAANWPRVLIAAGAKDQWYTAEKVSADEAFLKSHGVAHEIHRSDAGHEATDDMLAAAARFIARR